MLQMMKLSPKYVFDHFHHLVRFYVLAPRCESFWYLASLGCISGHLGCTKNPGSTRSPRDVQDLGVATSIDVEKDNRISMRTKDMVIWLSSPNISQTALC